MGTRFLLFSIEILKPTEFFLYNISQAGAQVKLNIQVNHPAICHVCGGKTSLLQN